MALIKTLDEFRKWVKVNSSNEFENLQGDIYLVEDKHIRKYLGPAFHKAFDIKYNAGPLEGKELELLDFLQLAISNLAQDSYLPLNQVSISDSSITVPADTQNKAAYKYMVNDLSANFLEKGFNGLERALEFLEENILEEVFAEWRESDASTIFLQHFITSAKEFSAEYNIKDSRLTYVNLLPIIKKIEVFSLKPVLGAPLYIEIKNQLKTRTLSEDNKLLLADYIRPAVAHLVAAKAMLEDGFELTPDGLKLKFSRNEDETRKDAGAAADLALNRKMHEANKDGQAFLAKLKEYLNKTASTEKYLSYFGSDLYTPPGGEAVFYQNATDAATFKCF